MAGLIEAFRQTGAAAVVRREIRLNTSMSGYENSTSTGSARRSRPRRARNWPNELPHCPRITGKPIRQKSPALHCPARSSAPTPPASARSSTARCPHKSASVTRGIADRTAQAAALLTLNTVGTVFSHAHVTLPRTCSPSNAPPLLGFEGRPAIRSAQNRKFKSVAILPLWLKQHTSLKNLKMHVASIHSKPSPDSI